MRVAALWRYPVKSMGGEQIEEADVGPRGITGDRAMAVVDANSGVALSAKRHGELLRCSARLESTVVTVTLPDGREVDADSDAAVTALSELLGRRVGLAVAEGAPAELEFPVDIEGGAGDEVMVVEGGGSGFHDASPLHLVTESTLETLSEAARGSAFVPRRFRPNLLVAGAPPGFPEQGWIGRRLHLGRLSAEVVDHCRRCVVTTRGQAGLPDDREILRTVKELNDTRVGVHLAPVGRGRVTVGDAINDTARHERVE